MRLLGQVAGLGRQPLLERSHDGLEALDEVLDPVHQDVDLAVEVLHPAGEVLADRPQAVGQLGGLDLALDFLTVDLDLLDAEDAGADDHVGHVLGHAGHVLGGLRDVCGDVWHGILLIVRYSATPRLPGALHLQEYAVRLTVASTPGPLRPLPATPQAR